ncbi:MAG TPA: outer membrane lipoprotein chaperone LolA [Terriglobales bacterium]|nr:outer membrane lipoprotein chaperone LolA [Terriglobales bacterium]
MRKIPGAILAVLLATAALRADDVQRLADSVDRRYNHLDTLTADFTEIYKGAGIQRTESGTLWLKKPGRMRWDYRNPREKLFLTDGKKAYFYVPGERQARQAPVKNIDDLRSPLRYLLGKTKLQKEFSGLALANIPPAATGNVVLQGVPKSMADRLSRVLLEVSPDGTIFRIVAEELDGSSTEFRFRNQQENVNIPDTRFQFHPPAGVEMIQAGDVGEY